MSPKINKKDLPLYLILLALRGLLSTPFANLILGFGKKHLVPDQNNWLETSYLKLALPNLPPAFAGYRLAQISDFHIGTWATRAHLEEAIQQVNEFQPDLVALTGDFVTHAPEQYAGDLVEILKLIRAKDGIVAVLGNHDHWTDPTIIREILSRVGIQELNNRIFTLRRDGAELNIAGLDDVMEDLHDLPAIISMLAGAQGSILLVHEPDIADAVAQTGLFDLQISGHTHGGQVQLPRFGALILPRLGKKYPAGLYRINDMVLYTNRGIGTAELQFRYNCPAEVTCFELVPAS